MKYNHNQLVALKERQFALHDFEHVDSVPFDLKDYSALKFGSDKAARLFGYKMADKFYMRHSDILINNKCVIVPSASKAVSVASTILAHHFMNRLNDLLSREGYDIVEWTLMHRTMSYILNYCTITSKDQRKELLEDDTFYINRDFIKGKTLLFVDDVRITGTHEEKVVNLLKGLGVTNQKIFCYCVSYHGNNPEIEALLNSAGIKTINDYIKLVNEPNHHLVVRAVRFLLDQTSANLKTALDNLDSNFIDKLYLACLANEYHKFDGYHDSFELVRARYDEIERAL